MSKSSFNQRLRALEAWQRQAFVAAMAEHALPNFQLFSHVTEFGNPDAVGKALDKAWRVIFLKQGKRPLEAMLDRLEQSTPDADDFDMYGVLPAIDAVVTISSALEAVLGDDPEICLGISKLSRSTVSAYIQATEAEPDVDTDSVAWRELLRSHPLMDHEFAFQNELLDKLEQAKRTEADMNSLRQWAQQGGTSNIGISLE